MQAVEKKVIPFSSYHMQMTGCFRKTLPGQHKIHLLLMVHDNSNLYLQEENINDHNQLYQLPIPE